MSLRITIRCPHCKAHAVARSSQEKTPTLREITYQCIDPECSYSYVAQLEIVRGLSASGKPSDTVRVPMSQHIRERVMQQLQLAI
jgi:C4-type Zn-finger protein